VSAKRRFVSARQGIVSGYRWAVSAKLYIDVSVSSKRWFVFNSAVIGP
jgi:hypothetical protein